MPSFLLLAHRRRIKLLTAKSPDLKFETKVNISNASINQCVGGWGSKYFYFKTRQFLYYGKSVLLISIIIKLIGNQRTRNKREKNASQIN